MQFKCADGSVIAHGLEKELHFLLLLVTLILFFSGSYLVPVGQVEVNVLVTGQLIKHIVEA